jgi:hypothetical protein
MASAMQPGGRSERQGEKEADLKKAAGPGDLGSEVGATGPPQDPEPEVGGQMSEVGHDGGAAAAGEMGSALAEILGRRLAEASALAVQEMERWFLVWVARHGSCELQKLRAEIRRGFASVRQDFRELHASKQRLEQMLSEGLFAFTRKVDAPSFKVFCAILAEGDVAKASRTLGLGDSTLRDLLRQWHGKKEAYQAMLDVVRWRKKVGGKGKVPFNDAVLHEKVSPADYPALLADVLDGLLSMREEDWQERCEELAELLRPHVAR